MGRPHLERTLNRPLFACWPSLTIPWVSLGELPTPVEPLEALAAELGDPGAPLFVKRDDLSSPTYGGNKVRTLEVLFGLAKAQGARRVYSTGAFGSNHALATVLHARRVGLEPGVILFPQPPSEAALDNLRAVLSQHPRVKALAHWSLLPLGMAQVARAEGKEAFVMVPGGATPEGALGYVSAALELAKQVETGLLPAPERIVAGVGSTCTSAGLLVGLRAAALLGLGWKEPPRLVAVRVTPWPVTSAFRILSLARRTSALLSELTREPRLAFGMRELSRRFEVDPAQLGRGYGKPTRSGLEAIALFRSSAGLALDTTYSAKSAASAIAFVRRGLRGPLLYWATKSTAPLPPNDDWHWAPRLMRRWIERNLR